MEFLSGRMSFNSRFIAVDRRFCSFYSRSINSDSTTNWICLNAIWMIARENGPHFFARWMSSERLKVMNILYILLFAPWRLRMSFAFFFSTFWQVFRTTHEHTQSLLHSIIGANCSLFSMQISISEVRKTPTKTYFEQKKRIQTADGLLKPPFTSGTHIF